MTFEAIDAESSPFDGFGWRKLRLVGQLLLQSRNLLEDLGDLPV